MCYNYTFTFPGCVHKVTTLELCLDRLGERQRIASGTGSFCGLFSPKERKVCDPQPRSILRNEPCPTCRRTQKSDNNTGRHRRNKYNDDAYRSQPSQSQQTPPRQGTFLNERQMREMYRLQETYRGKDAKPSNSVYRSDGGYYAPGPCPARPVPVPAAVVRQQQGYPRRPVPSYIKNKPLPPLPLKKAAAPKQTQPPPPQQARLPSTRRQRRSTTPYLGPVGYDEEPVPDDDFIDMVYTYNR